MKTENYRDIIKMLRSIVSSAMDLVENGLVTEDDIRNIVKYEDIAEELITSDFIYGD